MYIEQGIDVPESWNSEQCGECQYFIPLVFVNSSDYGVCSHQKSIKDGCVVFEHDGCEFFEGADEWVAGKFGQVEVDDG